MTIVVKFDIWAWGEKKMSEICARLLEEDLLPSNPMSATIAGDNTRALIDLGIVHMEKRHASSGKARVSRSEARHNLDLAERV